MEVKSFALLTVKSTADAAGKNRSAVPHGEMKSVHTPRSGISSLQRFHPSEAGFTRPKGRISLKKALAEASAFFMAAELGFEPRQYESES